MTQVLIASTNPVKIDCTKIAFSQMFPKENFNFQGLSVPSNISNQPKSEAETIKGALNRVENLSKLSPKADYWVGIEGGLRETDFGLGTSAWVVIKSKNNKFGYGCTGTFLLPKKVIELIKTGKELGEADDIVFHQENSKQSTGAIGILTDNLITRTTFYIPAVIIALIPFNKPELY